MATEHNHQVLRLRRKHAPGRHSRPAVADGERLASAQSVPSAAVAGLFVIVAFATLWAMLSVALARVFPWLTLLLGAFIGLAVRRAGQGLDWRFPTLAALLAFSGSIAANVIVAAANTAGNFDTGTFTILKNVTTMTWPVFFAEVVTAADFVFAAASAGVAAYYANRRLSRRQYQAFRIWQEQKNDD